MLRHTTVFVAALALAGCSGAVEGTPRAIGVIDPENYYGFELTPEEQQRLLLNQAVRGIEPCALLDEAAISEQGRILSLGPEGSIADCSVRYLPPGRASDHPVWVTVDLAYPVVLGARAGEVDGVPIYESSSAGGTDYCYRYVPLDIALPDVESGNADVTVMPPVAYAQVEVFGAEGPPCDAVAEIARMVVRSVRAGPPQRDADTPVPLGGIDPCALLDHLPAGYEPTGVRFDNSPFQCIIEFGERRLTITTQLQPDLLLDDERSVEWSGGDFVVSDPGGCFAEFRTGSRAETEPDDPRVAQVVFQTFTCDTVEELAEGIVAAYGA